MCSLYSHVTCTHCCPGIITGIQRDTARVLTTSSTPDMPDVRVVRGADIQRKLNPKNMVTTDMHMNQV